MAHVWIVEGRYGNAWLPITGASHSTRRAARKRLGYWRKGGAAAAYRVRKYTRAT